MLARGEQGLLDNCVKAVPPASKVQSGEKASSAGGQWVCELCSWDEWDGRKTVCSRCKAPRTNVPKKAPRRVGNSFRFTAKWKRFETEVVVPAGSQALLLVLIRNGVQAELGPITCEVAPSSTSATKTKAKSSSSSKTSLSAWLQPAATSAPSAGAPSLAPQLESLFASVPIMSALLAQQDADRGASSLPTAAAGDDAFERALVESGREAEAKAMRESQRDAERWPAEDDSMLQAVLVASSRVRKCENAIIFKLFARLMARTQQDAEVMRREEEELRWALEQSTSSSSNISNGNTSNISNSSSSSSNSNREAEELRWALEQSTSSSSNGSNGNISNISTTNSSNSSSGNSSSSNSNSDNNSSSNNSSSNGNSDSSSSSNSSNVSNRGSKSSSSNTAVKRGSSDDGGDGETIDLTDARSTDFILPIAPPPAAAGADITAPTLSPKSLREARLKRFCAPH